MLQGKPAGEPEAVTMGAIKSLLDEHQSEFTMLRSKAKRSRVLPDAAEGATTRPVVEVEPKMRKAKFTTVPSSTDADTAEMRAAGAVGSEDVPSEPRSGQETEHTKARIGSLKEVLKHVTPGRILTGSLLILAVFRPILVISLVLIWFLGTALTFLVLGTERVWSGLSWAVAIYARRYPDRAETIYAALDSIAYRWDAVLDMLPEGRVDGLYMPDFAHVAEQRWAEDDVIAQRLARLR